MEFSSKVGSIFLLKCRGTTASARRFLPKVVEKIINNNYTKSYSMTKFQKAGENTISCICFIKNKKKQYIATMKKIK